jgi:hypothetical protein
MRVPQAVQVVVERGVCAGVRIPSTAMFVSITETIQLPIPCGFGAGQFTPLTSLLVSVLQTCFTSATHGGYAYFI